MRVKLPLLLGIPLIVFSFSWEELQKKYEEQLKKYQNFKSPSPSPEMKKRIEESVKQAQERALKERERFELKDGKVGIKEKKEVGKEIKIGRDTVFYLLMSSSVPKNVWEGYADFVENAKLSEKVVFVLRGCVGGCAYIRPTLEFIQGILKDGNRERQIGIWIDPFIFRRFNVKEVPCLVMVKGDEIIEQGVSVGRVENLKKQGQSYISCGDWSFPYHLKVICDKSKEVSLCELARKYWQY